MIALVISLFMGFPQPDFVDRWPQTEFPLYSPLDFHPVPPAHIDLPPKNFRYGRGEIYGHCRMISETVHCTWERARV